MLTIGIRITGGRLEIIVYITVSQRLQSSHIFRLAIGLIEPSCIKFAVRIKLNVLCFLFR